MMGWHDVFSKRDKPLPDVFQYDDLPQTLRVQIVHVLKDTFLDTRRYDDGYIDYVHKVACEEHGCFELIRSPYQRMDHTEQIVECILQGTDMPLVFNVIELTMRASCMATKQGLLREDDLNEGVEKFNHRFRENGVGYFFDQPSQRLIRLDNTMLHESAIQPVLSLLTDKKFKSANAEFITAFDDYKKGDFGDCVAKACSAFESVLKIICDKERWTYDPNKATCGTLVQTVIKEGKLDPFLTEPLTLIGTIRNKKSTAHGAGGGKASVVRGVSEELARYCLNATASSILYVVEATK